MKTTLFLFATLFISTITFSQTTKKGYDHYAASSQSSASKKMNKGELVDAMAKDAKSSIKKYGKMGNHPNITQHNSFNSDSRQKSGRTGRNLQTRKAIKNAHNTNGLPTGKRTYEPNSKTKVEYQDGTDLFVRKRPGRSQGDPVPGIGITKEQGYQDGTDLFVRKRPGRSQTIGNYSTINSDKKLRKRPGRTKYKKSKSNSIINPPTPSKATDYNSSRSNKSY